MTDGRWIVDRRGRYGFVSRGRVTYAYGEQRAPLESEVAETLDDAEGSLRFREQTNDMWRRAMANERIAHAVLARIGVRRDTMLHDELYADVGVPTLCRAAVMWDEARGPEGAYCRRLLMNAYRRALATRHRHRGLGDLDVECSRRPASAEHGARDELLSLGLTQYELTLLLARFDSEESLEDIARSLGLSSRSTPLHHITKILDRCRRARRAQKS